MQVREASQAAPATDEVELVYWDVLAELDRYYTMPRPRPRCSRKVSKRYEHTIMANYHRLKSVDNVYRQRSAILDRLDDVERESAALERAPLSGTLPIHEKRRS